jgi:hypothetical protein
MVDHRSETDGLVAAKDERPLPPFCHTRNARPEEAAEPENCSSLLSVRGHRSARLLDSRPCNAVSWLGSVHRLSSSGARDELSSASPLRLRHCLHRGRCIPVLASVQRQDFLALASWLYIPHGPWSYCGRSSRFGRSSVSCAVNGLSHSRLGATPRSKRGLRIRGRPSHHARARGRNGSKADIQRAHELLG